MVQHLDKPALHKMWVLDAQWTDCPLDVYQIIRRLWTVHNLGNDVYILRRSIDDLLELEDLFTEEWDNQKREYVTEPLDIYPLIKYLRDKGIPDDEDIIIHWWW